MSNTLGVPPFRRSQVAILEARLRGPRHFLQVVAGPRQVGKTTLVRQAIATIDLTAHFASADDPGLRDRAWLDAQWQVGRVLADASPDAGAVLILDEIQKVPEWSEIVKRLWDEDTAAGRNLRVVVLGSAPLLVQRGLSDSLAGRFEILGLSHWGFAEMRDAFGWALERFLVFGGYPGSVPLVDDPDRWRAYILDSLIETTLSRDILLLNRVDKPALLRQLFRLGCDYSGQIVSYQKLVGQLQDAGNTTTLAHYLALLGDAGMVTGLQKYAGSRLRQRGSSPKLVALNTALVTAMTGRSGADVAADRDVRGRLVETAVGAHLVATAGRDIEILWWREGDREVDFVLAGRSGVLAVEVGSGRPKSSLPGLAAFKRQYGTTRTLLIGAQGLPLDVALATPAAGLLAG